MKLIIFLLLISVISVFASKTYSQTKVLNFEMKNSTVKEVLQNIENQSEFVFMYSEKFIDVQRKVSVNVKDQNISSVLDELFAGTDVNYKVKDRFILLTTPEISIEDLIVQQQRTVSGTVTDESSLPLPGVTVLVKGTAQGTITNADGNYTLVNVPEDAILVFSFLGMRSQEIGVGNQSMINLVMKEDVIGIEEVVAIGYGTQKKANLTGAVSIATAERLENRPITSVGTGLQGVIPNLNIEVTSGDPNTRTQYNIRGFESINGGNPLILVDGVPMQLDAINPSDIESVTVLKDAAASAVYGARAAFGVILVETKKGKQGFRVILNAEYGLSDPIYKFDQISDAYEFAVVTNEIHMDNIGRVAVTEEQLAKLKRYHDNPTPENMWGVNNGRLEYYGNSDIENYVLTDFAPQQIYDISLSGASEEASYYVSFGYLDKKGYLRNDEDNMNYKRYNILMKGDYKIKDWLAFDSKITMNIETNDEPHFYHNDRKLNSIIRYSPTFNPIKFPDLEYYLEPGDRENYAQYIGMYMNGSRAAPFFDLGGRDLTERYDTWLTQGITLTPLKGLRIRGDYSQQILYTLSEKQQTHVQMVQNNDLTNMRITLGQSATDYIQNNTNLDKYNVLNAYGEYTWEANENHYLKVMGGFNQEWGLNQMIYARAYDLSSQNIRNLGATSGTQQTDGSKSHVALRGVFYRLNYIYKDKYLFEANGRYDLSSRFPKKDRAGFFPSFSAAWRISNENFMAGTQSWLDNLKFRASYGTLGNQLLGNNYYPHFKYRIGAKGVCF